MFLVCNTFWWAWFILFIRACSSWSLVSNQSWCFLSGCQDMYWLCSTRPAAELPILSFPYPPIVFPPLAFGSVKNLYHKALAYNSAWRGVKLPEILQYLGYRNTCLPASDTVMVHCVTGALRNCRHLNLTTV